MARFDLPSAQREGWKLLKSQDKAQLYREFHLSALLAGTAQDLLKWTVR